MGSWAIALISIQIYSAPSGKFKKHVDTPRATDQMGSLVICLPSPHKGGALVARHGKQEMTFDWSDLSQEGDIQWAALFSDCEHEVLEVTAGHRVTLTYNLFWGESSEDEVDSIDVGSLPFSHDLFALTTNNEFLPHGKWHPMFNALILEADFSHQEASSDSLAPTATLIPPKAPSPISIACSKAST